MKINENKSSSKNNDEYIEEDIGTYAEKSMKTKICNNIT